MCMSHLHAQRGVVVDSAWPLEVKSTQGAVEMVPKSTSSQICTCVCVCVVGGWGIQIHGFFAPLRVFHALEYNTRPKHTGRGWLHDLLRTALTNMLLQVS